MTVDVVNQQNVKVGSVDLRDDVFGGRIKTDLIHESVVRANAADRRGTHATKTRAMVSGSGKKPWRQKGTGRARVGEIRNPLWRKGGTTFGPQPRSYDYQLPRKVEKGALRAALAQKLRDGDVVVVDALSVGEIKTKAAAEMLLKLGVDAPGAPRGRQARGQAGAVGAEPRGCSPVAEQPGECSRRHERATRRTDPGGARKAPGRARLNHDLRGGDRKNDYEAH